jgi:PAS domain S-box-containing protein
VNPGSRLDPSALDAVLDTLLDNNPRALVFAIAANGIFTQMPESFPLGMRYVLNGGHASALDLVIPDDVSPIIEAWTEARLTGCSRVTVHLSTDRDRAVTLHYVDALHRFGIYVGLLEVEGTETSVIALNVAPPLRPRVAQVRKNELAFVLSIDAATTQLLGWTPEEMVGRRSLEFLDREDHARAISSWMDMLRSPGSRRRIRVRHKHRDGSWLWFEMTNYNLLNDPEHGYVLTEMLDITDEMLAQEALRAREHLLRRLAEALPQGIFQVEPRGAVVYRNERLRSILGSDSVASVDDVLATVTSPYRDALRAALEAAVVDGHDADLEVGLRRAASDLRRCNFNVRALTDDVGAVTGAIVCVADVTESVQMRKELEERATFDVLTRTYNRASILHVLEQTLADDLPTPGTPGVLMAMGPGFCAELVLLQW